MVIVAEVPLVVAAIVEPSNATKALFDFDLSVPPEMLGSKHPPFVPAPPGHTRQTDFAVIESPKQEAASSSSAEMSFFMLCVVLYWHQMVPVTEVTEDGVPVMLIPKLSHCAREVVHVETAEVPPLALCAEESASGAEAEILSVVVLGIDGADGGAELECASRSMEIEPD